MARSRGKRGRNKKNIHLFNVKKIKMAIQKNGFHLLFGVLGVAFAVFIIINMRSFIFASEHFKVYEIEIIDKYPEKVSYPLSKVNGQNIFEVDLNKVAQDIERRYPYIQKVIVQRILPNKLLIEVLRRSPIAQIAINQGQNKNGGYCFFSVNDDAYILADLGAQPKQRLPIIYGTGLNLNDVEIGKSYKKSNLECAVSFLDALGENGFLKRYLVTKIDVTEMPNLSFYIDNRLEVRIGNRNWKRRIETLCGVLEDEEIDSSQDYYIDVRFKDIVFGKKS
ncbi:MAG: FtsQ-type POTRA domain-containing protein [Candidatus Omnitrophota bacterium]